MLFGGVKQMWNICVLRHFGQERTKVVRKCAILQVLEKYKLMSPYSVP